MMPRARCSTLSLVTLGLAAAAGCTDGAGALDSGPGAPDHGAPDSKLKAVFGGTRPVTLSVPSGYDGSKAVPLVLVLHGYGATGWVQERYLGFKSLVDQEGFLLAAPNGTLDKLGKLFWDATDACCNFYSSKVDDSAYLATLIAEIRAVYRVDAKRVYLVGHSNGGFMSYRMACDHADLLAAVISLAGATYSDPTKCKPGTRLSVLQIHGSNDLSVRYDGGTIAGSQVSYPGAKQTVQSWASYNGCGGTTSPGQALDIDGSLAGAETTVERTQGCPSGIDVELWTINGGGHLPIPNANFGPAAWSFFERHPKP